MSKFYNIDADRSGARAGTKDTALARQIAMYQIRRMTNLSLKEIGKEFEGRDHTTVMSADKKIRTLMAERRSTFNQVTELTSRIKQAAQSPA